MIGVFRSEWLKLRSVRSNLFMLASIFVLGVGLGALLTSCCREAAYAGAIQCGYQPSPAGPLRP